MTARVKQKPVAQRRAEARLAVLARLLKTGGQRAVERYVINERRDRLARQRSGPAVKAESRELQPTLFGEETP